MVLGSYNPVFAAHGLPPEMTIGSNTPGPHPESIERPVQHPEWDLPGADDYVVSSNMINEPPKEKFRIIMIGAGAAGIDFLHTASQALGGLNVEIVCYDKNPEVGGTWYENRYPGCECDVPSCGYTFPWRPNPYWSSFYVSAQEILKYFKDAVAAEGMMKYIQLNTQIVGASWDELSSKWNVNLLRVEEGTGKVVSEWTEECNLLINGTGFLNAWKWPTIPGIETFKGDIFHTANFQEGYSLKGKRVAVIGSGSSGVQVVASIYQQVDKLYTWVRNPTWITAAFGQRFAAKGGKNFRYTEEQKKEWARDPEKYQRYKKMIENELNRRYKLVLKNTRESDEANAFAYKEMSTKLQSKPYLVNAIIPKTFNVACRRPTPGNGYLEALAAESTTVFTENIGGITPTGVVSGGKEYPVDVIICATGFDTSFRPRFPIYGLDPKLSLAEKWAEYPASYLGISVDGFPNYLMYSGPFTPVAQGSILPITSMLSNHFVHIIQKMREEYIRRLSPKAKVIRDFVTHANTYLVRTCWSDPCTSWFKQGTKDGPIIMWPGSRLSYFEVAKQPKFEDYEVQYYQNNRWGFMGNGFTVAEFDKDADITWYLDYYSGRPEWKNGVPFNQDPDEFKGVAEGKVPGADPEKHFSDPLPISASVVPDGSRIGKIPLTIAIINEFSTATCLQIMDLALEVS